jgi:hypothetical protein
MLLHTPVTFADVALIVANHAPAEHQHLEYKRQFWASQEEAAKDVA